TGRGIMKKVRKSPEPVGPCRAAMTRIVPRLPACRSAKRCAGRLDCLAANSPLGWGGVVRAAPNTTHRPEPSKEKAVLFVHHQTPPSGTLAQLLDEAHNGCREALGLLLEGCRNYVQLRGCSLHFYLRK